MKAGEGGRTFGSVSTKEISAAVKEQLGLDIDKKKMSLNIPIKSFGTFDVVIKLHAKVTGSLRVKVTAASITDFRLCHFICLSYHFI